MPAKTASRPSALRRKALHYPLDRELVDDLVAANRTLARLGVLDAFGHISVRDPRDPRRYLISRSIAPESVSAADILLLDLDSQTVDPRDEGKLLHRVDVRPHLIDLAVDEALAIEHLAFIFWIDGLAVEIEPQNIRGGHRLRRDRP